MWLCAVWATKRGSGCGESFISEGLWHGGGCTCSSWWNFTGRVAWMIVCKGQCKSHRPHPPRSGGAAGQQSQYLCVKPWDFSPELGKQWDLSPDPRARWGLRTHRKNICWSLMPGRKAGGSEIVCGESQVDGQDKNQGCNCMRLHGMLDDQEDACVCARTLIEFFGTSWWSRALNLEGSLVGVIYHSTWPLPWGEKCCEWVCVCLRETVLIRKETERAAVCMKVVLPFFLLLLDIFKNICSLLCM